MTREQFTTDAVMYPILFRIGDFEVTTFGVLVALGALIGVSVFRAELRRSELPAEGVDAALIGVVGGLVGAKVIWALEFRDHGPFLSLLFSRGGLSWFGGFVGGVAAGLWALHRKHVPIIPALAAAAPALAVGHAIGRIGCFMVGDDYGRPTSLPWGVAFPEGLPPTSVPVHPTQLYEAAGLTVIASALIRWRRRDLSDVMVFARYLVLAGALRFLIEFVRVNTRVLGPFTIAHMISASIVAVGIWLMFVKREKVGGSQRRKARRLRMTRIGRIVAVALGCAALNIGGAAQSPIQPTLRVPAAANSTPSLAAVGRYVAAVWTATADGTTNVYFAMSDNGGATFSSPRRVNEQDGDAGATNEQPPRVAISGSGTTRTFTVLWSKRDLGPQDMRRDIIRIARSTDGGRTFSAARLTHDPAFSGARGWQSLAAGTNGALHAVWLDGRQAGSKIAAMAHKGTPHKGQPPQEVYHGVVTLDGRMVETRIAEDVCFCCKTAVAIDHRGHVYAAWRHIFPGSMRDIAFVKSTDGGNNFSPLVRVSGDNWQLNGCPEDGPSLAVDPSGVVHIAWATVVDDGDEPRKTVFYATSRDGKVFSPRIRVRTNGVSTPGHPQLALTSDGGAAIVFDEVIGGTRRVSLARVTRSGEVQPPQVLSGDESATHPVITGTAAGTVLVAWTSRSDSPSSLSTIQLRQVR